MNDIDYLLESLSNCLYLHEAVDICQQFKDAGMAIQWKAYREDMLVLHWENVEYTINF